MSNILNEIVDKKRSIVANRKSLYPVSLLEKSVFFESPCVSLVDYLLRADKSGIIAEIKRKSPSKGVINAHVSVEKLSIGYMQAGASALSVLTDFDFFGGKNDDLITARKFNYCPILRKDFIIDEYQIFEAKSIGADAILLIAAILSIEEMKQFSDLAHELGMQVLTEVHNKEEWEMVESVNTDLLGVNNRNLKTFEVDLKVSKELSKLSHGARALVSESGISSPQDIIDLKTYGYKGFLMGQSFMEKAQPEVACKKFIDSLRKIEAN